MLIDGFAHMVPPGLGEAIVSRAGAGSDVGRWQHLKALHDLEERAELMDEFGVDRQVVSLPQPAFEDMFDGPTGTEVARMANDAMAETVARGRGRWIGVAALSLRDPEGAVRELERATRQLHLAGAQIFSNIAGRALDAPQLEPFWTAAEELDVPLWLHPVRTVTRADYVDEEESPYMMYNYFAWPWDTTLAMGRLVLSGVMSRHPLLKIIVHHAGAMIPFLSGRIRHLYSDVELPDGATVMEAMARFYVDTCTWGSVSALMGAYGVFGTSHMVVGSDVPFGPDSGRRFLRETTRSLEYMPIPQAEREAVSAGNIVRLCHLDA